MRALTTVWVALQLAGYAAAQGSGYSFVVDGRPADPTIVSLAGTSDAPAPGDLACIGPMLVRLGPPGVYRFTDEVSKCGCLRLQRGGAEVVAAVDAKRLVEADAHTRKDLLGVRVDRWDEGVAAALASLDAAIPLVVTDVAAVGEGRALPVLPAAIQHLRLEWNSAEGFLDLRAAEALRDLRSLSLAGNHSGFVEVDLTQFGQAGELRWFECRQTRIVAAETVRAFRKLRTFLADRYPIPDLAWLREATELRKLRLFGGGKATSLAPLRDLPHLKSVEAIFMPITDLPVEGFCDLRYLNVQGTGVPIDQLRAFRKAHRDCVVHARVDAEQLRDALAKADRIVVRTGGTCHREPDQEKVLFDSGDAERVRRIAGLIEVEERDKDFFCKCCGHPTLLFFAKGVLVAEIGVHHGSSIRWKDGPWTSDAALRGDGREKLAEWLAEIGAPEAKEELTEMRERWLAAHRRARLRSAALGETLPAGASRQGAEERWLERTRAQQDGVVVALRLLSCHEGAWDRADAFDEKLVEVVNERLTDAAWQQWSRLAAAEERLAIGLAAVLLHRYERSELSAETLAATLGVVAKAALTHPQPWNRARMLQVLRDMPSEAALAILRDALAGRFAPRPAQSAELVAPTGSARIFPADSVLQAKDASVPVLAARCLAARGDVASLAAIRALAERCSVADRGIVEEAAQALAQTERSRRR